MTLRDAVREEQSAWATPDALRYYCTHRNKPDDLYESERFFLPEVLLKVQSVLDVGCATGGFSQIMRAYNPNLRYVGVDVIPEFIRAARLTYPLHEFQVTDGIHFPFSLQSFDLVHCSGALHLNSRYREMVRAMWAQTRRYLLCDFRITRGPSVTGHMELKFGDEVWSRSVLPYHVVNTEDLLAFLKSLSPPPGSIRARGYPHPVAPTAHVPLGQVIMAFIMLDKESGVNPELEINLGD